MENVGGHAPPPPQVSTALSSMISAGIRRHPQRYSRFLIRCTSRVVPGGAKYCKYNISPVFDCISPVFDLGGICFLCWFQRPCGRQNHLVMLQQRG